MAHRAFHSVSFTVLSLVLGGCAPFSKPAVIWEGTNTMVIRYSDNYGLRRFADHPIVEASINGVTGPFVIDSGTTIPILTMTGARRCGVRILPAPVATGDTWGDQIGMKVATNVSLQLAPGFVVHWPKVLVHPGEDVTF